MQDGALTVVEDISVFPNPAADIITVVVADEADITSLLVLDVLGNMVLQATVSADNFGMVQLDCSALAAEATGSLPKPANNSLLLHCRSFTDHHLAMI